MNEVEQQKMKNDKDKVRDSEVRLSDGFLQLADLVQDNIGVCRECVLTAFSLNPTVTCFERIKKMAVACGKCLPSSVNGNCDKDSQELDKRFQFSPNLIEDTKCQTDDDSCQKVPRADKKEVGIQIDTGQIKKSVLMKADEQNDCSHKTPNRTHTCYLHSPFVSNSKDPVKELCPSCDCTAITPEPVLLDKKERTLDALIMITGNAVTDSIHYNALSAPKVLDAEALGLAPYLSDDLSTVLSSPRNHLLSWVLDWSELSSICEKYLEEHNLKRNTPKELKFLNIDYSQFKDWPHEERDENYGIEKGYEQWIEFSDESEDGFKYYKSDTSDSSQERDYKKRVSRLGSSDSDYDSRGRITRSKTKTTYRQSPLYVYDSDDTCTQDSRTDSLGSDGSRVNKKIKKQCGNQDQMPRDCSNSKQTSKFQMVTVREDSMRSELTNHGEVVNIFNQMDQSKSVNNCISRSQPSLPSLLTASNKLSDPSVLKSLRMYRPYNSRKAPTLHLPDIPDVDEANIPPLRNDKFAPMLSKVDLNPRIILTRTENKSTSRFQGDFFQIKEGLGKGPTLNRFQYKKAFRRKSFQTISRGFHVEKNGNRRYDDILAQAVLQNDILLDTVSGLNSLDMIIPVPSEATVQVVQLSSGLNPTSTTITTRTTPATSPIISQALATASALPRTVVSLSNDEQSRPLKPLHSTSVISSDSSNITSTLSGPRFRTTATINTQLTSPLMTSQPVSKGSVLNTSSRSNFGNAMISTPSSLHTQMLVDRNVPITLSNPVTQMRTVSQSQTSTVTSLFTKLKNPVMAHVKSFPEASTSQVPSSYSGNSTSLLSTVRNVVPITTSSGVISSNAQIISGTQVQTAINQLVTNNVVSTHVNSSTAISAHIQRIGQPPMVCSKHPVKSPALPALATTAPVTKLVEFNRLPIIASSSNSSTNKSIEDTTKQIRSPTMVKYTYKDGILTKVYNKQDPSAQLHIVDISAVTGNKSPNSQNMEVPTTLHSSPNSTAVSKSVMSKSGDKNGHENSKISNQTASLPKFQQAFGKQMYQNNPLTSSSNTPSNNSNRISGISSLEYTQASSADNVTTLSSSTTPLCTVLSKAVQTTKETELTKSILQSARNEGISVGNSNITAMTSRSVQISTSSPTNQGLKSSNARSQNKGSLDGSTTTSVSSSVIFKCKVPVPVVGNTNLLHGKPVTILKTVLPPEIMVKLNADESKAKDSVIRSSMNPLLASALQSSIATPAIISSVNTTVSSAVPNNDKTPLKSVAGSERKKAETSTQIGSTANVQRVALPAIMQKNLHRQPVVQQQCTKFTRPGIQVSTASSSNQTSSPVVIPLSLRTVLAANVSQTGGSNSRTDTASEAIITHTTIEPSVSSTTLEQLREFESVLEQVTNTSQMKERSTVQTHSQIEQLTQQVNLPQTTTSGNVTSEYTSTSMSTPTALFQTSSTNTVHDIAGERVSLTFISQPSSVGVGVSTLIQGSSQKLTANTPVVVVQSCSRPVTSPALSVNSQSSSSPAPPLLSTSTSVGKVVTKSNKSSKSKSLSKTTPTSSTLKVSTLPKPQQKPQEDEQTTQRIYAILDKYAEQLRNSPELKNKPAPRRRSNPPTNPSQSSKRKKSTQTKTKLPSQQASCSSSGMEMSPGSEDIRTIGSEDSSNGVSQVLNSPHSRMDDPSTPTGGDLSSETSESLDAKDGRLQHRVILSETPQAQSRTVIVQDTLQPTVINVEGTKVLAGKQVVVGGTATMPLTLSLPGTGGVKQVLFPVPTDGRPFVVTKVPKMYRFHHVTVPSGSPLLTTTSSGAVVLRQMCVNKSGSGMKQVKLPVVGTQTQPSVVLPSGSHSFTFSTDSGLDQNDSVGINLDSTILLNTSSPPSVSFLHRSANSYHQSRETTSPSGLLTTAPITSVQETTPTISFSSASNTNTSNLKPDILALCASNIFPSSTSMIDQRRETEECSNNDESSTFITVGYKPINNIDLSCSGSIKTETEVTKVTTIVNKEDKDWSQFVQLVSGVKKPNSPVQEEVKENDEDLKQSKSDCQSPKESAIDAGTATAMDEQKKVQFQSDKKEDLVENCPASNDCVPEVKEEIKAVSCADEKSLDDDDDEDENDDVSSDSASSGRVKCYPSESVSSNDKIQLHSDDIETPWRYTAPKISPLSGINFVKKCDSPSNSPVEIVGRRSCDVENLSQTNRSLILSQSPTTCFKRKINNVENSIFQCITFRRSDRLRANSSKDQEYVHQRTVAALERELRLQKSLSEECEDLGVDEPSTSDLFPEAELLLDSDPLSRDSLPVEPFTRAVESSSSSSQESMNQLSVVPLINRKRRNYSIAKVQQMSKKKRKNCSNKDFTVLSKFNGSDNSKSESSGASTPVNREEIQICGLSEDSKDVPCPQGKSSEGNCKSIEIETSIDDDSIFPSNSITNLRTVEETVVPNSGSTISLDLPPMAVSSSVKIDPKDPNSPFTPIPNPAANTPYTYSSARNTYRITRKRKSSHAWPKRGEHDKDDDPVSDISEITEKVDGGYGMTTTDDSESEFYPTNGLDVELDRMCHSSKLRSAKCKGKHLIMTDTGKRWKKCSRSPVKLRSAMKRIKDQDFEEQGESSSSSPEVVSAENEICQARHVHHRLSRRSSPRRNIKKGRTCCNGAADKNKKKKDHTTLTTHLKMPIPIPPIPASSTPGKKTLNSKSVLKTQSSKKR